MPDFFDDSRIPNNPGHFSILSTRPSVPVVGGGGPPQILEFEFAAFSQIGGSGSAIDWSDIDQIMVENDTPLGSADWTLGSIVVVPEPSTALLGLIGLAGLARRRR